MDKCPVMSTKWVFTYFSGYSDDESTKVVTYALHTEFLTVNLNPESRKISGLSLSNIPLKYEWIAKGINLKVDGKNKHNLEFDMPVATRLT